MDEFNLDNDSTPRIQAAPEPHVHRGDRPHDDSAIRATEVHLLDYVKVLYKRRWTAITAFVLVVGAATVYTFTAIPIYEAKTRLLIESDERNVVSFQQVVDEDQTKADYYQTQYNILQSRQLARKTLDTLKLWDTPPFGGAPKAAGFSLRGTVKSAIKSVIGVFRTAPAPPVQVPGADETLAQSRAIDAFISGLVVTPVRTSRLVDVKYRSPDPDLATRIVNALAKNYIDQNLEYKFLASKEAADWLGARMGEQRAQVETAEAALQRYREQHDAIALEDHQNIVVQKLSDLNAAVTRAKMERIQKEALYNQLRASQANPASLDTFPAILANAFIQQQKSELAGLQQQQAQLNEKFGERHPDMQKIKTAIQVAQNKLTGEIGKVVQSVRSEYLSAMAQESSLTAALNQQKGEALSMNKKAIDYGVLERDVESTKQLYNSLMQRAKETGVAGELRTSNIRVVDAAERPRAPVSPNARANMLTALVAASVLAIGLVMFFEYLDSRIKSPEELKQHLGLPFFGMVPAITDKGIENPLISGPTPNNFSESFRAIRSNLLFSSAEEGSRSIVVTSTGPGEGKSLVAANLATALAQAGMRVMLIDADMRRPRVHGIFGTQADPGLSNVLVGNAKSSESVHKTAVPGLWILPAGALPPNPAELLGSKRFRDFMASLGQHFDWVIIDTPPVMAVTDASIVAHLATGVLFVVGAEMTSRRAAQRAIEQLEQSRAKFMGAVLNRVDLHRNPYYYSQYYRREYAEYYQQKAG